MHRKFRYKLKRREQALSNGLIDDCGSRLPHLSNKTRNCEPTPPALPRPMSAGLRIGPARPEVKSEWFSMYRIVGKEYRTDGIGEIVLARNNRESASTFTAILSGKEGVVAKAVVGLPGLASDPQFATFPSYTQANEFAQRLNEGLGLTPSQARTIVTDVMVKAQALISECDSLVQMARELRR